MISGKIILKSATKLSLDQRFSEIAKQTPPPPRIQQQANVIIPYSRQDLFGNKRPAALSAAQRLKKRSINYRLGGGANGNGGNRIGTAAALPPRPRVFQRLAFNNRRRNNTGGNSYLFGGQSGMGVRLGGRGRIERSRTFRSQTRGYLNNNAISRFNRGNRNRNNNNNNNNNNRGRRNGNNNFNRTNRSRGRNNFNRNGRGRNNNKKPTNNVSKETLDNELEKYMSSTKMDNDSIDMNAV